MDPIQIGAVSIKNRVVRPAHATNLGLGNMTDSLVNYHLERARGGVGLTIIEALSVHKSAPNSLNYWSEGIEDGYRRLVDLVRPHGMTLFQQLWHGGIVARPLDGSPPWSASAMPSSLLGITPISITKSMIDDLVDAYAKAAKSCEEWGIEGVEINAAHGYLIAAFLSPLHNHREDDYGGIFENHARILLEIMNAIRSSVSKKIAVGVRMSPDFDQGGLSPDLVLQYLQILQDDALIDYASISLGDTSTSLHKLVGGMHEPTGYELPSSTQISRKLAVPTIVTGRIRTLEEADQIIRLGDADMVGMMRAHIADPSIIRKTLGGHPEQVRPCIACNQGCLAGMMGQDFRLGWACQEFRVRGGIMGKKETLYAPTQSPGYP